MSPMDVRVKQQTCVMHGTHTINRKSTNYQRISNKLFIIVNEQAHQYQYLVPNIMSQNTNGKQ